MSTETVAALVALVLISAVVTLMIFPFAEGRLYLTSRPPRFLAGVLFMPLFVAIGVVLGAEWSLQARTTSLAVLLAGFWGSGAWMSHPTTQGKFVPGLEFGPGLNFRPDLILPGGVTLVKGIILTGIGMMLSFQAELTLPTWNWWGFVSAFFGILLLIPARGIAKMLARRNRFLGNPARWQGPVRVGLIILGLSVLLYGFLAAFMGFIPFVEFRPRGDLAWVAAGLIALSTLALSLREWWKRTFLEGLETQAQRFLSALWLYLSIVVFMYAAVVTFMGRLMTPHPATNPSGFAIGFVLVLSGAGLMLWLRPLALRNELLGAIRVMVGTLAAAEAEERWVTMTRRMRTMANYPVDQCSWHLGQMNRAISTLPPSEQAAIDESRLTVMSALSSEDRKAIMVAMDRLVA